MATLYTPASQAYRYLERRGRIILSTIANLQEITPQAFLPTIVHMRVHVSDEHWRGVTDTWSRAYALTVPSAHVSPLANHQLQIPLRISAGSLTTGEANDWMAAACNSRLPELERDVREHQQREEFRLRVQLAEAATATPSDVRALDMQMRERSPVQDAVTAIIAARFHQRAGVSKETYVRTTGGGNALAIHILELESPTPAELQAAISVVRMHMGASFGRALAGVPDPGALAAPEPVPEPKAEPTDLRVRVVRRRRG